MNPQSVVKEGFSYGNRMNFVNRYGVLENITKYYPSADNICSKRVENLASFNSVSQGS